MRLRATSPAAWLEAVLADMDGFLVDHAACERKASATALSLATHYPDRRELVGAMIDIAREELEHFHQVYQLMDARGLQLGADERSPYIKALRQNIKHGPQDYFLDRLLMAGVVEARGCERFGLIAEALPAGELKEFYQELTRSEARHFAVFLKLAKTYFPAEPVEARLDQWLDYDAAIIPTLEPRGTLH